MAEYTKEQIEAAATLNNSVFKSEHSAFQDGLCVWADDHSLRYWQPWADTEAGLSDALVLSREVDRTYYNVKFQHQTLELRHLMNARSIEWSWGNWQDWLDANMLVAIAIGQHMEQPNDN